MNSVTSNQVRGIESVIWLLDEAPLDTLHRAVIGFGLLPLQQLVLGSGASATALVAFVLATLLVLKFGFGLVRRLFPASAELKAAWRERRMLGKAYDSYEWQKMLGYGLGMLAFQFWSRPPHGVYTVFAGVCTFAGILGTICWQVRKRSLVVQVTA
jgi:hypothetical protein